MAVGDEVAVCDGEGNDYLSVLTKIRDNECEGKIIRKLEAKSESPVNITLYMAYPKSDKLETVVQKAVELGASLVVPFESSRCIKRPSPEKAAKNTERLTRIATEAGKQCGRSRLTKVREPIRFEELLGEIASYSLTLFCYEGEGTVSLKRVLEEHSEVRDIAVIIGSEGGFSPEEAEKIAERGAISVNLGPRILRCETAPDYCLSAISYYFEL